MCQYIQSKYHSKLETSKCTILNDTGCDIKRMGGENKGTARFGLTMRRQCPPPKKK